MLTSIPHSLDEGCIMTNIFVLYHTKGSTFRAHFNSDTKLILPPVTAIILKQLKKVKLCVISSVTKQKTYSLLRTHALFFKG